MGDEPTRAEVVKGTEVGDGEQSMVSQPTKLIRIASMTRATLDELDEVFLPLTSEVPSESELRVAQAQLVGWLEGLFHGIQASLWTQQMAAQAQLAEVRQKKALEGNTENT